MTNHLLGQLTHERLSPEQVEQVKLVVVMVGLPARGKSLIAQKIVRYLTWQSIPAKCFNVGHYRRGIAAHPGADFFSNGNPEGERLRRAAAEAAVRDMVSWFENQNGCVAVFDATNSTKDRRRWIADICANHGYMVMFVESICDDEEAIKRSVHDVKLKSPDYEGQNPDDAVADFIQRIKNYEKVYEPIDKEVESDLSHIQMINFNSKVVIHSITHYLQSRICFFCMSLHIKPRRIWLSRHGESMFNVTGKIGGDAELSPRGQAYARALPGLIAKSTQGRKPILWTSTLRRTIQTAAYLPFKPTQSWKALDELYAGMCDGLTYAEIEEQYPEDFKARDEDKYNYRYQGGESYRDVVIRLEPVMMQMEAQGDIIIISHQAVLRCIYAYLMNIPQTQSPWLEIPLHTVLMIEPRAYKTEVHRFAANIPAVSTYREQNSPAAASTPTGPDIDAIVSGTATPESFSTATLSASA